MVARMVIYIRAGGESERVSGAGAVELAGARLVVVSWLLRAVMVMVNS
jgi:hypothetical protein